MPWLWESCHWYRPWKLRVAVAVALWLAPTGGPAGTGLPLGSRSCRPCTDWPALIRMNVTVPHWNGFGEKVKPPIGASVIVTRTVVGDGSVHGPAPAAAGAGLGVGAAEGAAAGG